MGLYYGWTPRDMRYEYEARVRDHMDRLFKWFVDGKIKPRAKTYSLADFQQAMSEVLSRRAIGRVAVVNED
jgi:NADPH:quinone reductase-like Zn-dependent oxidoreductase